MKVGAVILLAMLAAACASRPPVDARDMAERSGLSADAPHTTHGCRYAQALPGDAAADFMSATCVVFADRLTIVRPRAPIINSAYFRYRALDGIAVASRGSRSQLQMRAAGTVLVVEMEAAGDGAQQRAFTSAQREGVPVFSPVFVSGRATATFVPPAF